MLLQSLVISSIVALLVQADDWRGDPCERAGIPWTPFTTHARLDPASSSRVVTRTRSQHEHFRTKQEINVINGEEDTIVVDFDVLLSDESLQDHVKLVQKDNEVALIIDGHGAADRHHDECVVVVTTVSLPEELYRLTIDATSGSVFLDDLKAKLDSLDVLLGAGSVTMKNNHIEAEKVNIDLGAGNVYIDGGLRAKKQQIKSKAGTISGALLAWESIDIGFHGAAGGTDLSLLDSGKNNATASIINVQTSSGTIHLNSHLKYANITASTGAGSIDVSVRSDVVTDAVLESSVGSVRYPDEMTVVEERRKGFVGRLVKGRIGSGQVTSSVVLNTGAGSIHLGTSGASKNKHTGL